MTTKRHTISHRALVAVSAISAAAAIEAVSASMLKFIDNNPDVVPPPQAAIVRNDVAEYNRLAAAIRSGEKPLAEFIADFQDANQTTTADLKGLSSDGGPTDVDGAELDHFLGQLFNGPEDEDTDEDEINSRERALEDADAL